MYQSIVTGLQEAIDDTQMITTIRNAMQDTGRTYDDICDMLDVSEADKKRYAKML